MCTEQKQEHQAYVQVSREDLEREHSWLLQRLHQVRRLLGHPPIETARKQREDARKQIA